jgi:hypothetical protein
MEKVNEKIFIQIRKEREKNSVKKKVSAVYVQI